MKIRLPRELQEKLLAMGATQGTNGDWYPPPHLGSKKFSSMGLAVSFWAPRLAVNTMIPFANAVTCWALNRYLGMPWPWTVVLLTVLIMIGISVRERERKQRAAQTKNSPQRSSALSNEGSSREDCESASPSLPQTLNNQTLRVLLAEDEKLMASIMDDLLLGQSYGVIKASTIGEAIDAFEANSIDVAIFGVAFEGDSRDGFDLLERLQGRDPDVVAVLVTGWLGGGSLNSARRIAIRAGFYEYLPKPFTNEVFLEVVAAAVKERLLRKSSVVRS